MYDKVFYLGKTLSEWAKAFGYQFTMGELYRMTIEGANFMKMNALKDVALSS